MQSKMLKLASVICSFNSDSFFEESERQFKTIFTIVAIVFAAMVVGSIVLTVFFVRRGHKATKNIVNKVKEKITQNIEYEKTKNICEYCGGHIEESENKCSNCGAQRRRK